MRWWFVLLSVGCIRFANSQQFTGSYLSEGAGGTISSILGYSAYPTQNNAGDMLGVFGIKHIQAELKNVGFISSMKTGRHSLVLGGDRFGNGVLNRDNVWAGYAIPIAARSNLGIRAGVDAWNAKGYKSSVSVTAGLGWSIEFSDRMHWKLQFDGVENFWLKEPTTGYLLRTVLFYSVSDPAGLSVEVVIEEGQLPLIITAFHYSFLNKIYCRAGAISNLQSVGVGIGFKESYWGLETAMYMQNRLGVNILTLLYIKL